MFNKFAGLKCTSGYAINEKKQIAKLHFPPKNADLKKQRIRFVNRRYWLTRKHLVLSVEEKF